MKKTGISKVFGRTPDGVRNFYNRTGKKDKDGKPIFEILTYFDFSGGKKQYL